MKTEKTIVVTEDELVRLTVSGEEGRTCVYLTIFNGRIVFTGGASIIERIEGEGMSEKFKK
ncbi:MAG: hypothetical protein HYT94_03490 [Parcubacteria group bacterium]|nr:hypothetical protein [Parcubacteria group bacterium]